jgi:hypothetical protein
MSSLPRLMQPSLAAAGANQRSLCSIMLQQRGPLLLVLHACWMMDQPSARGCSESTTFPPMLGPSTSTRSASVPPSTPGAWSRGRWWRCSCQLSFCFCAPQEQYKVRGCNELLYFALLFARCRWLKQSCMCSRLEKQCEMCSCSKMK